METTADVDGVRASLAKIGLGSTKIVLAGAKEKSKRATVSEG